VIGLVIVSHSARLAEGIIELAREMGGDDLSLCGVGGLDAPDRPLGTDPIMILDAIESAYSEEGVLVLMDLGSAVLSAEMALEMLPPEKAANVLLCSAPLVEGTLAAVVQARLGTSLQDIASEAQNALQAKITHLGNTISSNSIAAPISTPGVGREDLHLCIKVTNPLGLHARPATHFVRTAGNFPDVILKVKNQTTGRGPVSARSINGVTTLGVRKGHEILITAAGSNAQSALDALKQLADHNFYDQEPPQPYAQSRNKYSPIDLGYKSRNALQGLAVSPGIAIGPVNQFHSTLPTVPEHLITDSQSAWNALEDSIEATRNQIQLDYESATHQTNRYTAAIFDAHLLFLEDEALLSPTRARIFDQKINPAAAWMQTIKEIAARYLDLDDPYLQTRARDIEDVGKRVLINLLGLDSSKPTFAGSGILVAPDLPTADMVHLNPSGVQGILTAFGGPTSHAAILARAMGIPAVAGLGEGILDLQEGILLVINGENGQVWVDPAVETIAYFEKLARDTEESRTQILKEGKKPAVTRDGHQIEIVANISIATEALRAIDSGAEGVGVFRTEYLFLGRVKPPDEDEQVMAYQTAALGLAGRPLIIRTLDAGGDKRIPYLNLPQEANPFLGWRGLRVCLENTDLFKTQLRAIIRTAAKYPVKILFPMVTNLAEWREAQSYIKDAIREVSERGQDIPEEIESGIMVEVPAAALLSELFAEEVDFFSIGTNDLAQYLMAAERGNPKVTQLSDALNPAVLQMIQRVVESAHDKGKWVGVCGELAGDADAIPILVGLGVDELSMNATAIPRAKQIIRGLEYATACRYAHAAIKLDSAEAVRSMCISTK
jgi:phosphocarrier protein FPr